MDRRIIRSSADAMVDIMVLEPMLDVYIDMYRHDPNLMVEVPFDEYKSFVLFVLGEKKYMFEKSENLKSLVKQSVTSTNVISLICLKQNYILDVMSAAAKELHLAERRKRCATLIRFSLPRAQKVYALDYAEQPTDERYRLFYRRLELLGYSFPSNFCSEENLKISKYIDVCVRACLIDSTVDFLVKGF